MAPLDETFATVPDWVRDRMVVPRDGALTLQFLDPGFPLPPRRPTVVFTMWESAGLKPIGSLAQPGGAPHWWSRAFSTRSASAAFSGAGLPCPPLGLVPLGVDLETFTPEESSRAYDCFTVGMAGRMLHGGVRKGILEGSRRFGSFPTQ